MPQWAHRIQRIIEATGEALLPRVQSQSSSKHPKSLNAGITAVMVASSQRLAIYSDINVRSLAPPKSQHAIAVEQSLRERPHEMATWPTINANRALLPIVNPIKRSFEVMLELRNGNVPNFLTA